MPSPSPFSSIHADRLSTIRRVVTARGTATALLALLACGMPVLPAAQTTASEGAAAPAVRNESHAGERAHTFFLQAGAAKETDMLVAGVTMDWSWHKDLAVGRLGGYWEMSFGRWGTDHPAGDASTWVAQFGVTPVLRLYPRAWGGRWFVEGGIGANLLLPVYRSRDKRFSTSFNFGDHLAVGRRFGQHAEHEVALRVQHFSNAGIRSPNPGEDFIQLRYGRQF